MANAPWPTRLHCAIHITLFLHLHWVQQPTRPTHVQWLQYEAWAHHGMAHLAGNIVTSAGPSNMDLIH
jgi:hypothetical protein